MKRAKRRNYMTRAQRIKMIERLQWKVIQTVRLFKVPKGMG